MTQQGDAHTQAAEEPQKVLVVDDDDALRGLISQFLQNQGFEVYEASGAVAMRAAMARTAIDVVILDLMMPGEGGLALARELVGTQVGVIIVSALGSETDRIVGLEVGADDYLAKPISPRELLARIRAVLRRRKLPHMAEEDAGKIYHFAGWTFDAARRVLRDPSSVVTMLSSSELALLHVLLERPQRVLTRDQLLELTRKDAGEVFDRSIDTQISRLRRKLASRGGEDIVRTIRSEGYMFYPKVDLR